MGYKIQFEDITNVQREISNSMVIWNNSINKLLKAIKNFSDDSSLKGETMDSIKVYLYEVHGTLLVSMQNLLQDYAYSFLLYKDGYYNIDSDSKAKLSEQTFVNLRKELSDSRNNFANQIDLLISTKNKVSNLISYSGNSHDTTISNYNFLIGGLDTINNRIIAYEKLHQSQDLKLFKELLLSTRNFMENYSNRARDINSYQSGDLAKIDFAKELAVAFENSNRYLSNRRDIIEEAQKRDKVRWEEILAKERRNRGIKNLIVGGLTLLVGTGAIIATGGSGTPLVIAFAGKVFGTGTVAYSVSNLTEAGQDTIYGSLGDNETRSINPIRDTIFLGNNKLYHGTGHFFTIGSSILIPIGKTNSLVKGVLQYAGGSAGAWLGGKVGYYGLKGLGFSEENAKIGEFIVSMLGAYAGSKIASGFTLNKTFKLDESFLKLNTKVEQIKLRAGIWLEDKFERGIEIDGLRGNSLGSNYPVVDKYDNGVVTSIKSRNLSDKSYQNGKILEYTIKRDINILKDFEMVDWAGKEYASLPIKIRNLEVVVPNMSLNEHQINAINKMIKYGKINGVNLIIVVGGN